MPAAECKLAAEALERRGYVRLKSAGWNAPVAFVEDVSGAADGRSAQRQQPALRLRQDLSDGYCMLSVVNITDVVDLVGELLPRRIRRLIGLACDNDLRRSTGSR